MKLRSPREFGRDGTPAYIKLVPNLERAASEPLNLHSAEPRDHSLPLANCSRTDLQRASDIRGRFKVIKNVLCEHGQHLTTVHLGLQPESNRVVLTSVEMTTLADRLKEAMGTEVTPSELARACKVSPAAVSKWLDGRTASMKATPLALAAKALGVRDDWLRTGRLPKDREGADEDRQIDQVISILQGLREPLSALSQAIESLGDLKALPARKRTRL